MAGSFWLVIPAQAGIQQLSARQRHWMTRFAVEKRFPHARE
jgi:hypothetical protein